jgi:hypothetical protein
MINELSKAGDTENQIGRLVLGATAPLPEGHEPNGGGWHQRYSRGGPLRGPRLQSPSMIRSVKPLPNLSFTHESSLRIAERDAGLVAAPYTRLPARHRLIGR